MGEAAALGSAAFWALSTLVIKGVSGRLSAFSIMAVRTAIAAVILLPGVALLSPGQITLDVPTGALVILVGSAMVGGLGDVAFVRAIALDDTSRMFTASNSLFILLSIGGGILLAGDPLSWLLIVAGAIILAGSRLVLSESHELMGASLARSRPARRPLLALGLCAFASLLWAGSLLAVSDAMDDMDPLTAAVLRMPAVGVALVAIVGVRGDFRRSPLVQGDLRSLALSGACVLGSMLLFLVAVSEASAGGVAVLSSTSPLFAVIGAFFLLREQVTPRVAAGTMVCLAGIWVAFM